MQQPTLPTPLVVSGILHPRFADVEALLHREGFITGAIFRPASSAQLQQLLLAMGQAGEPSGAAAAAAAAADTAVAPEALVIPLAGRRCIVRGGALPQPSAPALQACAAAIARSLLGALAPQHARCLLAPASEPAQRASATLLAELVAPPPPPRLPASATLARAHAARAGSRAAAAAAAEPHRPARGGECLVSLEEVLGFVFPPGAVHPRSMGRLVLYALQGPLREGRLVGGRLALARALSEREVDTEIDALEEEDVLAAFTGGSVLGGSVEPVLRSVRLDGAAHMPRMSVQQVEGLLAPVVAAAAAAARAADAERGGGGGGGASSSGSASSSSAPLYPRAALLSFHGLQAAVLRARALRVADLRRAFPPAILASQAPARLLPAPPVLGRNVLAPGLAGSTAPLAALVGATRRGPANSGECWEKQSVIARARKVDMLLHTRLQQVARECGPPPRARALLLPTPLPHTHILHHARPLLPLLQQYGPLALAQSARRWWPTRSSCATTGTGGTGSGSRRASLR